MIRGLPIGLQGWLATGTLACLGRSWRFRDARGDGRPDARLPPAVYVLWHESIAPLAYLHRHQGAAVVASRNRDGEIIARALRRMGFRPVRGSSSRGGREAWSALVREARAGRAIALTPDGPRGPARSVAPGAILAAARSGLPVVPVGVAATRARRLDSWDRFLVPLPGATVWVSRGDPIVLPPGAVPGRAEWQQRIRDALEEQRLRCEERAAGQEPSRAGSGVHAAIEARVRRAWTGRPGTPLKAASAAFALGAELRNFAYDSGLRATERAPLPVISIGGLTAGGSGKTPVARTVADWLEEGGHRPAVLTHGFADEEWLHRGDRSPGRLVIGDRDRVRAARRAIAADATVVVLDDGFQHRQLERDLDLLLIDLDALVRTGGRRLPAGPFREGAAAIHRADGVILTSRDPASAAAGRMLEEWLERRHREVPKGRLHIIPGSIRPANQAAGAAPPRPPAVCLTGIMKPNLFFSQARDAVPGIRRFHAVPDHAVPDAATWERLRTAAGPGGFLCTWKDVPRLRALASAVPLWALEERIIWDTGEDLLRDLVLAAAR